jgi:hypothetical protein
MEIAGSLVIRMKQISLLSRSLAILLALLVVGFVCISNTSPFNISTTYTNSNNKDTLVLSPKTRVVSSNGVSIQKDDLIYFGSKMFFKFDNAVVKIKFKNLSSEQRILLGYSDQRQWHYSSKVLDAPFMDNISWTKISSGSAYLYQKKVEYKSLEDFYKNPPQNKFVGVFEFANSEILQPNIELPNYKPQNKNTSIDVPIRGNAVMNAYLNKEPFNMRFTKRDLNWYADPDVVKVSVFKNQDKVFDATIDDDGNSTNNHKIGQPEIVNIKNPGPSLPEAGVYKIVIDAPVDSVITNITTNLHKIAFEGPLYVADNHEVYGDIVTKTKPTTLTTNAQQLSFRSDHGQSKTATIEKQVVNVKKPKQVFTATNTAPTANISIPGSDMIVNGSGYFALSADQYFAPTPYKILPVNSAEDVAQADYILTDYKTPKHEGDWLVADREFGLHDAVIQKGQLSWLLSAPGLKENKRTVEYKSIEMTLTKKGWLKQ